LHDLLGFGKKTHIELPAESPGLLPRPGRKHPNGRLEWSMSTPFSIAFGHNIQTNSIQLLRAYAVLANGGILVEPTLVRKIVKKNAQGQEEILLDNTSQERINSFPRVFSPEIIKEVVTSMKYVTKPRGSAPSANVPGYTEAGKTGTPEKIINGFYTEGKHCPSFIGFAPVGHSAFVLLVTIDEPEVGYRAGIGKLHMGGTCAAPVFKEIAKRSLEYLGIAPDDPFGYPVGDPRYDAEKADWIKESRLLQGMYEKWNNKSQTLETHR
jgi:cell division protein FtsI (penicillin-binding protein 3)